MSQREEFVTLARESGLSFSELCRRYGISRKSGYKWCARFEQSGVAGLADRSRRPKRSPARTSAALTQAVLALRQEEPTWGGRKLRRRLRDLKLEQVPAASTCTQILRRAGLLESVRAQSGPWQRFEHPYPNALWQLDHKGDFATQSGRRCHPLTMLDDHSRYNLLLEACDNQKADTVRAALSGAFRRYGLPEALLCDNGPPWGTAEPVARYTSLGVWLLRLGVRVWHGRPYHPQTQGKEERFHRTLENDLLVRHTWRDLDHCAREFSAYRQRYNSIRPHDSLGGATPASRYQCSPRSFPEVLAPIQYPLTDRVLTVRTDGTFRFAKRLWYIGRAFGSLPIGLRPSAQADGQWLVCFAQYQLGQLVLSMPAEPDSYATSIYLHPIKT